MALEDIRKSFTGRAAAIGLTAMAAVTPLTFSWAQDARTAGTFPVVATTSSIQMVEDASIAAGLHSESNPGIAVAVFLGTHESTPAPERIRDVLSGDFQKAGISDPISFYFEQNDTPGTGTAFYFGGDMHGPFLLGPSRKEVPETAATYLFRKNNGMLASISFDQ